jgi:DNA-binding response OmpR family regulator
MKQRPRILYVDPEAADREVVASISASLGADLVVSLSGSEALKKASTEDFDAILLDILMADNSGYEICRTLKADRDRSDTPLLFVTTRIRTEEILAGFQALAFDFLVKPFRQRELKARLQNAIRMKALLDELKLRVRFYERCLWTVRRLEEAGNEEDLRQVVVLWMSDIAEAYNADGVSFTLSEKDQAYSWGKNAGPAAAEIPVSQAGLSGVFRLARNTPADSEEKARLVELAGLLARGVRRFLEIRERRERVSA